MWKIGQENSKEKTIFFGDNAAFDCVCYSSKRWNFKWWLGREGCVQGNGLVLLPQNVLVTVVACSSNAPHHFSLPFAHAHLALLYVKWEGLCQMPSLWSWASSLLHCEPNELLLIIYIVYCIVMAAGNWLRTICKLLLSGDCVFV